jgi:hypothetical protein
MKIKPGWRCRSSTARSKRHTARVSSDGKPWGSRPGSQLERHDVVEGVLRDILLLKFTRKNVDVGRERDILDRLPPGSIDGEVARQYDEFCRAKKTPPSDS